MGEEAAGREGGPIDMNRRMLFRQRLNIKRIRANSNLETCNHFAMWKDVSKRG